MPARAPRREARRGARVTPTSRAAAVGSYTVILRALLMSPPPVAAPARGDRRDAWCPGARPGSVEPRPGPDGNSTGAEECEVPRPPPGRAGAGRMGASA